MLDLGHSKSRFPLSLSDSQTLTLATMSDPEPSLPAPDSDELPLVAVEENNNEVEKEDDDDIKPKVGMYFETEDDAYEFYKKYAEAMGFVVRKSHKSRNTRLAVTKRWYVCHRQGFKQERSETKNPRSPGSRTGCGACLCIKIIPCGAFRVTEFVEDHNHPLADQPVVKMIVGRAPPLIDPKIGPALDMRFETEDDAYEFYNKYAEHVGFSVRKSYKKKHKGMLVSRIFVCSREGFAEKDKHRDPEEAPRRAGPAPSRTGCQACLIIKVTPPSKSFRVSRFIPEHNHPLEDPESVHKLRSHKLKTRLIDLDLPEFQRRKRMRGILAGDAGATLEYLQNLQVENPSLFYAVGTNNESKATNFFWADSKSVLDYYYFNDTIFFDTTFTLNTYTRPFALFFGVDNHRQLLIFGCALIYDDSSEGLKWVFNAFNDAMGGKMPGSVMTDLGEKYVSAVRAVWPGSKHRATAWHVYYSARMNLRQLVDNAKAGFMHSFAPVMFENEEEGAFLSAWEKLIEKYNLSDNNWMSELYRNKEIWAAPYGKHVFTADIITSLRKENMLNTLRKELNEQEDIIQFLKKFEHLLEEHRSAKLPVDTETPLPIPSLRMLRQVGNLYTTAAFKIFQLEFEDYMNSIAYRQAVIGGMVEEYKVNVDEKPSEHTVRYDSLDGSASCTCKKFENIGILCSHLLKVLDYKNIKELPAQYILKRWTKEARTGRVQTELPDNGLRSDKEMRYRSLCRMASMIAARACRADEAVGYVEAQSVELMKHLNHILQAGAGFAEMGNHAAVGVAGNVIRGGQQQGHPLLRGTNGILGV